MSDPTKKLDIATSTIADGKAWLRTRIDEGAECPLCHQHAKRYKRKLNSGMAASLVAFARVTQQMQPKDGWLRVPDDFVQTTKLLTVLKNREYNKLRYWGLLEMHDLDHDLEATPFTGMWRITELGFQFVREEIKVPRHVFLYDGRKLGGPQGDVPETTTIRQALGDRFNFDELMGLQ